MMLLGVILSETEIRRLSIEITPPSVKKNCARCCVQTLAWEVDFFCNLRPWVQGFAGQPDWDLFFQSCLVKSSAMALLCCVTVFFNSWRTLIKDSISGKFRNKDPAASTNASFTIFPSWLPSLLKLAVRNMAAVQTAEILVPSPFSFSACSQIFILFLTH